MWVILDHSLIAKKKKNRWLPMRLKLGSISSLSSMFFIYLFFYAVLSCYHTIERVKAQLPEYYKETSSQNSYSEKCGPEHHQCVPCIALTVTQRTGWDDYWSFRLYVHSSSGLYIKFMLVLRVRPHGPTMSDRQTLLPNHRRSKMTSHSLKRWNWIW